MRPGFDLDPAQWSTLRGLLDAALDLPAEQRAAWVEQLDSAHETLKPRLKQLLAHAAAGAGASPLDTLPKVETAQFLAASAGGGALQAGEAVGPYRLIRPLGEGGMGSVWLAERTDMLQRRQVALKLPHLLGPRAALAERLAREREILAALNHPHIARLYDAGVTADGQPWLALEYVEGERIDAHCSRKGLDVPARLRLFMQVARAVAHAHASLVVHRDLKPSNILVTEAGDVRLLDFGIAKLVLDGPAQETELTQFAGRALTPDYAAPEQILGQPITTAADVYALGVVLFELLAGTRPYRLKRESRAALEEAITGAEPQRPSEAARDPSLRRRLRGDLDTIVGKALKKAPAERYRTVEALIDDIERHLALRPVLARPDSGWYRARRFVARNRLAVGAGGAVAIALVGGASVAWWQARVARAEQLRAAAEARAAAESARVAEATSALADFLIADLAIGRSTTELEQQLERAVRVVRQDYASDPLVRARLLLRISGRFRQIGVFSRATALESEAEATAREAGDSYTLVLLGCRRAREQASTGQVEQARQHFAAVVPWLHTVVPRPIGALSSCLADESAVARLAGDSARAIGAIEEVRALEEAAGLAQRETHADTLLSLARAYALAGRYRDAVEAAQRSIDLRERIGRGDTTGMLNMRLLLATFTRDGGQPLRALAILDEQLAHHRARGGAAQSAVALLYERALTLVGMGRHDEALPQLAEAKQGALATQNHTLVRASSVAEIRALASAGRAPQARAALQRAEPLYTKIRADRLYIARLFLFAAADVALAEGDAASAAAAIEEAAVVLATAKTADDPALRHLHGYRARLALAQDDAGAALRHAEAALAISRRQAIDPQASAHVGEDLLLRARAQQGAGDRDAADRDAQEAARHIQATAGAQHPGLGAGVAPR
jgi:serine/threonine-protein kinase